LDATKRGPQTYSVSSTIPLASAPEPLSIRTGLRIEEIGMKSTMISLEIGLILKGLALRLKIVLRMTVPVVNVVRELRVVISPYGRLRMRIWKERVLDRTLGINVV
jgi:hypothetical protein